MTQVGVHYKQFNGNSFYFRGGLHYQFVDYKFDLSNAISEDRREISSFKGESLVGSVAIGNQWQFKYLNIGCDWIGLASPITYRIHSARPPQSASNFESDQQTFEDVKRVYVAGSSAILLRFYLGASF